jgi:hypothetical protein
MTLLAHMPQVGASDDWLTDPLVIQALGPFDLDPACPSKMPWQRAATMWTKADDSLNRDWDGFVWLGCQVGQPWQWDCAVGGSD